MVAELVLAPWLLVLYWNPGPNINHYIQYPMYSLDQCFVAGVALQGKTPSTAWCISGDRARRIKVLDNDANVVRGPEIDVSETLRRGARGTPYVRGDNTGG